MPAKLERARAIAKKPSGPKYGRIHLKVRSIHPAMRAFKALFANKNKKLPTELELRTGASRSFCEKVLSGALQPGEPMITALLQSDVGDEILTALMGAARPRWWRGFRRSLDLAALVRAQARTQDAIEKMQREMAE